MMVSFCSCAETKRKTSNCGGQVGTKRRDQRLLKLWFSDLCSNVSCGSFLGSWLRTEQCKKLPLVNLSRTSWIRSFSSWLCHSATYSGSKAQVQWKGRVCEEEATASARAGRSSSSHWIGEETSAAWETTEILSEGGETHTTTANTFRGNSISGTWNMNYTKSV